MSSYDEYRDELEEKTGESSPCDWKNIKYVNWNLLSKEHRGECSVIGCTKLRKKGTRTTLCTTHWKETRFQRIPTSSTSYEEKKEAEYKRKEQEHFKEMIEKGMREEGQTILKKN